MKNSGPGTSPSNSKTYRGQSAEERTDERRKRLVETAVELYGTHGFRATSVKSVCVTAGLTERYFYESFANGEALLCETCSVIMDDLRRRAAEAMAQVDDTLSKRVEVAARTYFSTLLEHPAAGRIILFEMEGVSAAVDAHYAKELVKSTRLFVEWFLSRIDQDAAQTLNASILAQGIVGALYQIAKEWLRSDVKLPVDVMARHMQVVTLGICTAADECRDDIPAVEH